MCVIFGPLGCPKWIGGLASKKTQQYQHSTISAIETFKMVASFRFLHWLSLPRLASKQRFFVSFTEVSLSHKTHLSYHIQWSFKRIWVPAINIIYMEKLVSWEQTVAITRYNMVNTILNLPFGIYVYRPVVAMFGIVSHFVSHTKCGNVLLARLTKGQLGTAPSISPKT